MQVDNSLMLQYLEKVSWRVLAVHPDVVREMIGGRSGLYVLYGQDTLLHVGLTTDLFGRLEAHLKDRQNGKWDRFSVYLTAQDDDMKHLESLLHGFVDPSENPPPSPIPEAGNHSIGSDAPRQAKIKWGTIKQTLKKRGTLRGLLTREDLLFLYEKEGLSLEDIAQRFGVTRTAVSLALKAYGISARGRSKARILALSKGKFKERTTARLHESIFSRWSQPMAYLLGYIFTDGSLGHTSGNTFRVTISSIDREHLEKLADILGEGVTVETRKQSTKGFSGKEDRYLYVIGFTRPEMIEDLRNLGLTERKSLTMQFPDVPEEFLRDFIRGCWDGDGSIYLLEQYGNRSLSASFVTGSKDFIEAMRSRLDNRGFGRLTIHTHQPDGIKTKNPTYSVKISSNPAVKLCQFLYEDVPEHLLLSRKFLIYKNFAPNLTRRVKPEKSQLRVKCLGRGEDDTSSRKIRVLFYPFNPGDTNPPHNPVRSQGDRNPSPPSQIADSQTHTLASEGEKESKG